MKRFISTIIAFSMIFATACEDPSPKKESKTPEKAYEQAQKFGYEGTWEDFCDELDLLGGESYKEVYVNDNGQLVIVNEDGEEKIYQKLTPNSLHPNASSVFLSIGVNIKNTYGLEWIYEVVSAFEKAYEDVSFQKDQRGVSMVVDSTTEGGELSELTDLAFLEYTQSVKSGNAAFCDLTETIETPLSEFGEEKSIQDKLSFDADTAEGKWYALPFAEEYFGIVYNKDVFEKFDFKTPNTTNEWLALCEEMTAKTVPMIYSQWSEYEYLNPFIEVFWKQYEGISDYRSFWNGETVEVLSQEGRLKALQVYEDIFGNTAYFHEKSFSSIYREQDVEMDFLDSLYYDEKPIAMLFDDDCTMARMDYFLYEIEAKQGERPNIGMMKTPVISSIIEKCPTIPDDETLSNVIEAIDNGEQSYVGVSAADFQRIKEARGVTFSIERCFVIEKNISSTKQAIAKQFLRFLSTDKALSVVADNSSLRLLTYERTQAQLDRLDSLKQDAHTIARTEVKFPDETAFPLYQKGLRSFEEEIKIENTAYAGFLSALRKGITAEEYFQATIEKNAFVFE